MKNSKTTNATNTKYDILNKNNNKSKNHNNCTLKTNAKRSILKPPKVINKNPLITKYNKIYNKHTFLKPNQTDKIKIKNGHSFRMAKSLISSVIKKYAYFYNFSLLARRHIIYIPL